MSRKKKKPKYKKSVIRGRIVYGNTKQEFNENKSYYRKQGIKSAYALQQHRDILKRKEAKIIKEEKIQLLRAYGMENTSYLAAGITYQYVEKMYKEMRAYNKKVEKWEKKGLLPPGYAGRARILYTPTGKINFKRTERSYNNMKSLKELTEDLEYRLRINVKYSMSTETYQRYIKTIDNVPLMERIKRFSRYEELKTLVEYYILDFDDDSKIYKIVWGPVLESEDLFISVLESFNKTK